jgi:uncharacterized membrane protein YbhN (UPF0104 family)
MMGFHEDHDPESKQIIWIIMRVITIILIICLAEIFLRMLQSGTFLKMLNIQ